MFKRFYILLILLCISSKGIHAQANVEDSSASIIGKASAAILVDDGIKLFNSSKFKEANTKFRQATIKNPRSAKAHYWVSNTYYYMNLYGYALQYAQKSLAMDPKIDSDIHFIIARSFHELNKVDSALVYYELAQKKLTSSISKDFQIEKRIAECKMSLKYFVNEYETIKFPISSINTDYNEYAPILVNDGKTLYFTSRRPNSTGGIINPNDDQYFEDIYQAEWSDSAQKWINVTNKIGKINGPGFEAFSYVKNDQSYALMTLNNSATDSGIDTKSSDICEVTQNNKGQWTSVKLIANSSINTSYFDGAATLSKDGDLMVFASDRKEEKTLTDLYIVKKSGKRWGEAQRMNDLINTVENETTPYLSSDGKYLFFSSNGHEGFGGYDIYVCSKLANGQWSKPANLGPKINTVNNDTHFQYYPELNKAVMASMVVTESSTSINIFEIDLTNYLFPVNK